MPAGSGQRPSEVVRAAVARGALTPERARWWLERAADGEDISVVASMRGPGPRPVSWRVTGSLWPVAEDDAEDEQERADRLALYPPRTAEEAEERWAQLQAAAAAAEPYSDDELHALLFGEGG